MRVLAIGDGRVPALQQVLIKAEVLSQGSEGSLEATGEGVKLGEIQAFVVEPLYLEDNPQVTALGQERMLVEKGTHVHQSAERAGCLMILPDLTDPTQHGGTPRS